MSATPGRNGACPAFPSFVTNEVWDKDVERYVRRELPVGGMDIRDYFAARALPFCCLRVREYAPNVPVEHHATTAANQAYAIADAMLKARSAS